MTAQELYGRLAAILVDELGADATNVAPEATYDALGLDSLGVVELVLTVEEELGISIDDEELEGISTLQQLADALAARSEAIA